MDHTELLKSLRTVDPISLLLTLQLSPPPCYDRAMDLHQAFSLVIDPGMILRAQGLRGLALQWLPAS